MTDLYTGDAVCLQSEQKLQKLVNELEKVCERRELQAYTGRIRGIMFERKD